ncbi:hypothetical protein HHO41_21825 [Bacillus sp. DNRA2]|uniref:hypothetical protein n=1 Tax=Bacillus sp. DNRA2 TaxID=2723053 RepID=UPI00145DD416|nr:hypothetical protein [Bacillus sp. DNRA2]NMD72859.1 hypothetical protein [Bacillus sp. DNRA2]
MTKWGNFQLTNTDDLFVSPNFYNYVLQTVEKYDKYDSIAGISLYTHLWNVGVSRPFIPQYNGFDVYFLQYAQSWGQVWTKRMWNQFYNWYITNKNNWKGDVELPNNIQTWPDSSWLKYFISYVTNTNRYFVYPYFSLTTNFTDVGTHNKLVNTSFQVPLLTYDINHYNLPKFNDKSLKYDVFFEQLNLADEIGFPSDEMCIDLFGNKNNTNNRRYWLTNRHLDYMVIKEFALQLKPHELNVIYDLSGKGIFLYDTFYKGNKIVHNEIKLLKASEVRYDVRAVSNKRLLSLLWYELKNKFYRVIKK